MAEQNLAFLQYMGFFGAIIFLLGSSLAIDLGLKVTPILSLLLSFGIVGYTFGLIPLLVYITTFVIFGILPD